MCTHAPLHTCVYVHVCTMVHGHVGIRVCLVHTPTLTCAPSHLPLHNCVHTQSTYPYPDTCSKHVHTQTPRWQLPSPVSPTPPPRRPGCWKARPSATHTHVDSPRKVSMGVSVGRGAAGRAASHTPAGPLPAPLFVQLLLLAPHPLPAWGGGRTSHAGEGAGRNWP